MSRQPCRQSEAAPYGETAPLRWPKNQEQAAAGENDERPLETCHRTAEKSARDPTHLIRLKQRREAVKAFPQCHEITRERPINPNYTGLTDMAHNTMVHPSGNFFDTAHPDSPGANTWAGRVAPSIVHPPGRRQKHATRRQTKHLRPTCSGENKTGPQTETKERQCAPAGASARAVTTKLKL